MVFWANIWKFNYRITIVVVSYLFILLFLYAGVSKLLDFENFSYQLAQSPLLGAFASQIAWMVPAVELLIALLLMAKRFRVVALYASFALMCTFTAYIFITLNFSDFVPCSCGGVLETMSWKQHLIFNLFFIVLAGLTILLCRRKGMGKRFFVLIVLSVLSSGLITGLFLFSERKMHRNNAFQRRFVPQPLEFVNAIDLNYNSYYFAGITDSLIYLGNVTAPLNLMEIDLTLKNKTRHIIQLDAMDLPYQRILINVHDPIFYVSDGNVPVLLKGTTDNWKAHTLLYNEFYFSSLIPVKENLLIIKTIDGKTKQQVLGSYNLGSRNLIKNFSLLKSEKSKIFGTDGQLLYDAISNQLVYIYYYKNEYIVFDNELNLTLQGRTIDTITQAKLELIQNSETKETKVSGTAVVVNKYAAIANEYLYIISERLGAYEKNESLDQATIVDVYKYLDQTYQFSFYIYNYKHSKVSQFLIYNNDLFALMGNYLASYKLNEKYFN